MLGASIKDIFAGVHYTLLNKRLRLRKQQLRHDTSVGYFQITMLPVSFHNFVSSPFYQPSIAFGLALLDTDLEVGYSITSDRMV